MKKIFLAVAICSIFVACSGPTKIISSWRDPAVTVSPTFHKVVCAALIRDQSVRRQVEDYMASLYPGSATQSYLILGDSLVNDSNGETQRLKHMGFDGVVVIKQTDMNEQKYLVSGIYPAYYGTWGGFYGYGYGPYYAAPAYVETDRTWIVQVNAYSLITNKLIWTANTSTTNPGGRVPLFQDVCNAVAKEMRHQKFLLRH
jgi:hypothetical protein